MLYVIISISSSFNGYSNALSFKHINDDKIKAVETYVRNELAETMTNICVRDKKTVDAMDLKHFFGIYDTATDRFRFLPGDIDLIKELVSSVQENINKYGENYYSSENQGKITHRDTLQLSTGLFFARKEKTLDVAVAQTGASSVNEQQAKENLFCKKLKPLLMSSNKLEIFHPVDPDIVKIVKKNGKIRAEVLCVFCPGEKHFGIQCNQASNSNVCYWNYTNYKNHVKLHEKNAKKNNAVGNEHEDTNDSIHEEDDASPMEILKQIQVQNNEVEIEEDYKQKQTARAARKRILDHSKDQTFDSKLEKISPKKSQREISSCCTDSVDEHTHKIIVDQMLARNLKNVTATLRNSDKSELMMFKFNDSDQNVKVALINPDGSCFFASIVHQLYGFVIGSNQHEKMTASLRKNVIEHIQNNFNEYRHDLQGRVYENSTTKIDSDDLLSVCERFLNEDLTLDTCYAGIESVKAISEIKKINIVTISEHGECYFAVDFNPNFDRTVFLAHRLNSVCTKSNSRPHNTQRNHYDSVAEIDNNVLLTLAEMLYSSNLQKMKKQMNSNNNSIISINSTL